MKKIIILLFLLILMSCSKESGSQKSFENLMSTFQSGNEEQIIKISERNFSDNPFNQYFFEEAPFYLQSFKKIKYKIIEVKEDKNTATIKFLIEAPNLSEYSIEPYLKLSTSQLTFSGYNKKEILFQATNAAYSSILARNDLKYIKKELSLNIVKKKGKWVIDENSPDFIEFVAVLIERKTSF